ncbi:DNA helicase UvrD [Haloferula helveola]|uniref:DNA helicase UvrD n=1 Tax=Haloferula helveola TaxID=490095 RepID=A0ABM7RIM5_9BACT|nr:DNA helicase UvrD [Haloferula helveola]
MREVIYIDQAGFRESMMRLRKKGGASQRAFDEACRIIKCLELEADVSNKLTKHGESRIDHCIKYDISNDAHRLVTVHTNNFIYLLFIGSHDETESWLNRNRGLTVTCNPSTRRITVTHVTRDEPRETPQVSMENLTEANLPYLERIGVDPAEYVSQRVLARSLSRINDDTSDEELGELVEDLSDVDKAISNLMLDLLFEIREGKLDAAEARLEQYHAEAVAVQEQEELEREAIASIENSERLINLTGLNEEQLKDLFSPGKFHKWMLFLHPEQKRVAEAKYERPTVLTGVSGSGKTCVLVHRARQLARRYPGERIGVITLNRSLTRLIDNLISQLCTEEERANIHVTAFYDYFAGLVEHFTPAKELDQLRDLAAGHDESDDILRAIDRVDPKRFAREFCQLSGETLDDTWALFCDQDSVRTRLTYFREHLYKYDDWVDSRKYLREEFSLIRSAVPTSNRVKGYQELERHGRAIRFTDAVKKNVLEMLLLYEETMFTGGILDELGLTLALVPHLTELKTLPPEMRFRCLLIDEFQDLSTRDLALLRLIPTGTDDGFFLTGDTVQRVMVKDLRLGAVGLDIINSTRERILKNYRNSRQILEAASYLANAYGKEAKDLGEDVEVLDPELAVRETSYPMAVECEAGKDVSRAWEYARECIQTGAAIPWSICIVTASEEISPADIIAACPADFPVKAGKITGDYTEQTDTLSVASMADVKGFEFSLVLIVGCGAKLLPSKNGCQKESWREALRLYVAMTRARDEVRLFYSGKPSPFLATMNEGLYWQELGKES